MWLKYYMARALTNRWVLAVAVAAVVGSLAQAAFYGLALFIRSL